MADKEQQSKPTDDSPKKFGLTKRMNLVLVIASVIVSIVGLAFGIRYALNARFLSDYDSGTYSATLPNTLTYMNFSDRYVAYHNLGCALYMMEGYDLAAGAFATALDENPPHDEPYPSQECQVRINLALSLVRPVDVTRWRTEDDKKKMLETLNAARNYLTEDGCANPAKDVFDGHSEDAEQLKKDIDAAIEKLNDPENDGSGGDDSNDQNNNDDGNGGGGGGGGQNESGLQEKLQQRKSEAAKERAEDQQEARDESQSGSSSGSSSGGSEGDDQEGDGRYHGKTW